MVPLDNSPTFSQLCLQWGLVSKKWKAMTDTLLVENFRADLVSLHPKILLKINAFVPIEELFVSLRSPIPLTGVLGQLTSLTELHVSRPFTDISKLTNLTKLRYSGYMPPDFFRDEITPLTNLRELGLTIFGLTAGLSLINTAAQSSRLRNLTSLETNVISVIEPLTSLTQLDVYSNGLCDDDIQRLTNLRILRSSCYSALSRTVLSNLTNLETLHLFNHETETLFLLTKLVDLDLSASHITDEQISLLTNLTRLVLASCPSITNHAVYELKNLAFITATETQITKYGVSHLQNLQEINLEEAEELSDLVSDDSESQSEESSNSSSY